MPSQMITTAADDATDEGIAIEVMLDEWELIEFDFQRVLGTNLESDPPTWRRFLILLAGLFSQEQSLIRQHFRPTDEERKALSEAERPIDPEEL